MLPFQNPLVLRGVEDMWGGNRASGCWLNRNVLTKTSEEGGCRLPWVLIDYGIGMVMPVQIGEPE